MPSAPPRDSFLFKPRQSGNPLGRPKVIKQIQELACARSRQALDALTAIVSDPEKPTAARVRHPSKLHVPRGARPRTDPGAVVSLSKRQLNNALAADRKR